MCVAASRDRHRQDSPTYRLGDVRGRAAAAGSRRRTCRATREAVRSNGSYSLYELVCELHRGAGSIATPSDRGAVATFGADAEDARRRSRRNDRNAARLRADARLADPCDPADALN